MARGQPDRQAHRGLGLRFWNTIRQNYILGFTSFGGPPVHFKIVSLQLHVRFRFTMAEQSLTDWSVTVSRQVCKEASMDRRAGGA